MLKKLHTQNTRFWKIQVLIVLVFCIFGIDTCLINFSKFYNKFRTCISSLIHYYIILKLIQNILKIIWNSKTIHKTVSGQNGWSPDRPVPIAGQNGRPRLSPRGVHICAHCQSTDRSTANPCGRPTNWSTKRP